MESSICTTTLGKVEDIESIIPNDERDRKPKKASIIASILFEMIKRDITLYEDMDDFLEEKKRELKLKSRFDKNNLLEYYKILCDKKTLKYEDRYIRLLSVKNLVKKMKEYNEDYDKLVTELVSRKYESFEHITQFLIEYAKRNNIFVSSEQVRSYYRFMCEKGKFIYDSHYDILLRKRVHKDEITRDPKMDKLVAEMIKRQFKSREEIQIFLHEKRIEYGTVSAFTLLAYYKKLCSDGVYEYQDKYSLMLQSRPQRGQSGVMVIAVFTAPYPEYIDEKTGKLTRQEFSCEYDCYYCPAEPGQPRSYLLKEPGVMRANQNKFDAVCQFHDRANTYENMGHETTKVELLVLGGTWSSYPEPYQYEFIRDCFYAANTYDDPEYKTNPRLRLSLAEEQKLNENNMCRIIGITLETRPDRITKREIRKFRTMGVTRIQMGVQHTDDRILYRINRQCTSEKAIRAIRLLKRNCFKIDIHLMPDLPAPLKPNVSNKNAEFTHDDIDETVDMYELDKEMFKTIFTDQDWQIDQMKIYPCEVVPWTRIETEYRNGIYKPYGDQKDLTEWTKLCDLMIEIKPSIPEWIRVNRLIRDIPNEYIIGGNQDTNLRTRIQSELAKNGKRCRCIRCREVKGKDVDVNKAILKVTTYDASGGTEYFISITSEDDTTLYGFLRLRLDPNSGKGFTDFDHDICFDELLNCALIRELHVYGQVRKISDDNELLAGKKSAQHSGFGKRLVNKAFEIAKEHQYKKIAVISGVGVKDYYRKFGFEDEEFFMCYTFPTLPIVDVEHSISSIVDVKHSTSSIVDVKYKYMLNYIMLCIFLITITYLSFIY